MSAIWRKLAKAAIVLSSLLVPISALGQIDALQGHCTLGGTKALLSGMSSTNYNQGVIPGCTVTVYLTGTTTLATIYSNSTGTALANPFTAVQAGSPNPGYWIFWAADGQGYDVKMSGGGGNPACSTAPNCYVIPLTYTDLKVGGGGGGGTGVTTFSAGNLNPLFNTAVTNPSTTPNLSFTQQNAAANTLFGNFTGTAGPPFFATFTCTGLLTCTYDGSTNIWNVNIPSTSTLSVTATSPILVNGGAGPVSSGTANISCPTCGTPQIQMSVTPPAAGNYVVLYPATSDYTTGSSGYCPGWNAANPTGYGVTFPNYSGFFTGGTCQNTLSGWVDSNGNPWPLSYINPANVTAVYAVSINSYQAGSATPPYSGAPFLGNPSLICTGSSSILNNTPSAAQVNSTTTLTGATIASATCVGKIIQGSSIGSFVASAVLDAPVVALYVYSTDAPTPTSGALNIGPYLDYNRSTNTLTTAKNFPQFINASIVANLASNPWTFGHLAYVFDYTSTSPGLCGTGGGGISALAVWRNYGVSWGWYCIPTDSLGSGGGGSGTYFTEVVTCTSTCTLTHTPTTFDNLSVNGLILINGTDFTQSSTTITLSTPAVGGDVYYAQYHY